MPKSRLSNEHSPQTERERLEIAFRPAEYDNFHGRFNQVRVGEKLFPYTVRGVRRAMSYAKETGQDAFAFRRVGKNKRNK